MISFRSIAALMDPVRSATRLRGSEEPPRSGLEQWYWEPAIGKLDYANDIGRWHRGDKGLSQMHRTPTGQPLLSLREIGRRHEDPQRRFRLLWYNTWLIDPPFSANDPPELDRRAREIGARIGSGGWDAVAMCEAFGKETRERITEAAGAHRKYHSAWGGQDAASYTDSGLLDMSFDDVRIGGGSWHSFTAEGEGIDIEGFASKGVLYRELILQRETDGPLFRLNLFSTHLHAENAKVRRNQIAELVEYVKATGRNDAPKLVVGDFNVFDQGGDRPVTGGIYNPDEWTTDTEYDHLLRAMSGYEDLWLTRGGLAGSTLSSSDYTKTCEFDPASPQSQRYCNDYPGGQLSPDQVPGKRIDYAFLERPTAQHSILIDVARVRRRPFFRDQISFEGTHTNSRTVPILPLRHDQFWTDSTPVAGQVPSLTLAPRYTGFLSDHLALEIDLIFTNI